MIVSFSCVNIKKLEIGDRNTCFGVGQIEQNIPFETVNAKVSKIITLNNYYIVYVQSESKIYKILSYIETDNICREIQLDSNYSFVLQLMKSSVNMEEKCLANKAVVGRWIVIGEAAIACQEGDSVRGLYFAENLKGLCLSDIDTLQVSPNE